MSKDILTVDSDKMNSLAGVLNRASAYLDDSVSSSKNSLSFLQKSPTLSAGINKLHGNMSVMAQRLSGFGGTLNRQNEKIIENELYLDRLIDQIEIPTELANVDTTFDSESVSMDLSKTDGKAVNANNNTSLQSISEESEVNEILLTNINNKSANDTQEFKDAYNIQMEDNLVNIDNNREVDQKEIDSNYSVEERKLVDIDNGVVNESNLTDEYDIEKKDVEAVNANNNTSLQSINEVSNVNKILLTDINNKSANDIQKLKDSYSIQIEDNLVNINNNREVDQKEFDSNYSVKERKLVDISNRVVNEFSLTDEYDIEKVKLNNIYNIDIPTTSEFKFDDSDIEKSTFNG